MPAKKSNGSGRPWAITPVNIRDFRRARELQGADHSIQRSIELYSDPVHRDEYRAISDRLFLSFDCRLWIDHVLDVQEWRPPADHDLAEYQRVFDIRRALEEALIQDRPTGSLVHSIAEGLSEARQAKTLISGAPARSANGHQRKRA